MAVTLLQEAGAGASGTGLFCSGATAVGDSPVSRSMASTGTDTTALTCDIGNGQDDRAELMFEYDADTDGYDFGSGDWQVQLDVTTAGDIVWTEAWICRVNSSGVNQETLASALALGISLNSTGNKDSGTFNQASVPSFSAGDRIVVVIVIDNNSPHGGVTSSLRLNTTVGISAPGTEGGGGGLGIPIAMAHYRKMRAA